MEYNRSDIVDAYIKKRQQGMDYTHIRRELQNLNIEETEIKTIIRLVDNYDRHNLFKKTESARGNELIGAGVFLLAVGLGVTIGLSNSKIIVLAYGAIIAGLGLIGAGWSKKRK